MVAPSVHEVVVSTQRAPLPTVAALAASGRFGQYVAYERGGDHVFAGGAVAQVRIDPDAVRACRAGEEIERPWGSSPLRQAGDLLSAFPGWQRAYGWVCFELAPACADPAARPAPAGEPLACFVVPAVEISFRGERAHISGTDAAAVGEAAELVVSAPVPLGGQTAGIDIRGSADTADDRYRTAVSTAVGEIRDGRYQKVILSREVEVPFPVDLPATYLLGRQANTPARSFLLDLGGWQAAGFSPETVLEVDEEGVVSTQPLAGTRALGLGDDADAMLREELLRDPKEIFEHAISVKIAYDELLPLCEPGTVSVGEFMTVRPRGSVQHLASRVRGRLRADHSAWDALHELFPAVTASGVPKPPAYEAIARLESSPRGLYAGAVVVATRGGGLDAALVLRALYRRGGRTWLRAGAGVVGDSRPCREFDETCEKLGSVAPYLVGEQGELRAG